MRQWLAVLSVVSAVVALVKYLQASGNEHLLRLSQQDLTRQLRLGLPLTIDTSPFSHLRLDEPRVQLREGYNAIAVSLSVSLVLPTSERHLTGDLQFTAGVALCADAGSLYLCDPEINHCKLVDLPGQYDVRLRTALRAAIAKFCTDTALYPFAGTVAGERLAGMKLNDVMVVDRNLMVALDTQKASNRAAFYQS